MAEKVWRIEYDNTTHPDGDGGSSFEQWWTVTDGERSFRAEYQDDAELLAAALNAYVLPDNAEIVRLDAAGGQSERMES